MYNKVKHYWRKNKKKAIKVLLLLFIVFIIIKLFLAGPYLYHFWEELLPIIIILTLVSSIMMILPIIFRLVNKKNLDYVKGTKVCLLNSLIIFIVFSIPNILNILKGPNHNEVMSFDPTSFSKKLIIVYLFIAVIYYFINILLFVDNKKNK